MVSVAFSPNVMPPSTLSTPSSQPIVRLATRKPREVACFCGKCLSQHCTADGLPLITRPTPIGVLKSPLPTEESNLPHKHVSATKSSFIIESNLLLALLVWGAIIVEVASVLHCDGIALLGPINAVTGRDGLLRYTHDVMLSNRDCEKFFSEVK